MPNESLLPILFTIFRNIVSTAWQGLFDVIFFCICDVIIWPFKIRLKFTLTLLDGSTGYFSVLEISDFRSNSALVASIVLI